MSGAASSAPLSSAAAIIAPSSRRRAAAPPAALASSCVHAALAHAAASYGTTLSPTARGFDMTRWRQRHIALHLLYVGHDLHGFASQESGGGEVGGLAPSRKRARASEPSSAGDKDKHLPTVEALLFGALVKACLIESRTTSGYTRCGRTDKGVSAGGQVISIRLRSRALRADGGLRDAYDASSACNDVGVVVANESTATHATAVVRGGAAAAEMSPNAAPLDIGGTESVNSTIGIADAPGRVGDSRALIDVDEDCAWRGWRRADGLANTGAPFPSPADETDYALILNNILPPEVRVLGWSDVPDDFSARFTATLRGYRFYFPARDLDTVAMRSAAARLVGVHDFRNMCKIDLTNTQNFERELISLRIAPAYEPDAHALAESTAPRAASAADVATADAAAVAHATQVSGGTAVLMIEVVGRAFLWHQMRCIAALLFLVGRGLEDADSVAALLDVSRVPARPAYTMASEAPLILHHCGFGEELDCADDGVADEITTAARYGEGTAGAAAASSRPVRFLAAYPSAAASSANFFASPAALSKLEQELESQWSALVVRAALVRGLLDRVGDVHVDSAALDRFVGAPNSATAAAIAEFVANTGDAPGADATADTSRCPCGSSLAQVTSAEQRAEHARGARHQKWLRTMAAGPQAVIGGAASAPEPSARMSWREARARYGGRAGLALGCSSPIPHLADADYSIVLSMGRSGASGGGSAGAGADAAPADAASASLLRPVGYTPLLARTQGKDVGARWAELGDGTRASILRKHPTNALRLDTAVLERKKSK